MLAYQKQFRQAENRIRTNYTLWTEHNENGSYTMWNVVWWLDVMANNQHVSIQLDGIISNVIDNCSSRLLVIEHDVCMLRPTNRQYMYTTEYCYAI